MRIGCLQFAPRVGEFESNKSRAEAILARADPEDLQSLDLLVLPEMALSGYNFKSREHIEPHLEPTTAGPSAQWAREKAREYGCTVAVGYPEKVEGFEREYYNSLVVVNSQGETLANYRKSFLYYTDETWAREGQGFFRGPLGNFGQVAMGICMDINPYKFEAPWDAYEFGFHVQRLRPNLVILSMAWLTNDDRTKFLSMPDKPDLSTLSYWVQRLTPVLHDKSGDETIVVFSNRCGIEDDATYAGTSTVLGIKNGEVVIYGILGRNVEELLVVDTRDLPMGELVTRSTTSVEDEDSEAEETNHRPGAEPRRPSANSEGSGRGVDSPTLPPSNSRSSAGGHTHATAQQANMNINGQRNLETPSPRSNALSARPKLSLVTDSAVLALSLFSPSLIRTPFSNNISEDAATIPIIIQGCCPEDLDQLANTSSWYSPPPGSLPPWSRVGSPLSDSGLLRTGGDGAIPIVLSPSVLEGLSSGICVW